MGLKNRKKFKRMCERYGLTCKEDRDLREILTFKGGSGYPERAGIVTFYELRDPDWVKLEDLVVFISVHTGAWME